MLECMFPGSCKSNGGKNAASIQQRLQKDDHFED